MNKLGVGGHVQICIVLLLLTPIQALSSMEYIGDSGRDQINQVAAKALVSICSNDNLLRWTAVDTKSGFPVGNAYYFDQYDFDVPVNRFGFSSFYLAGDCNSRFHQSCSLIEKHEFPQFELYQPGNEFIIGFTLPLFKFQPSPMLKVNIGHDLYREKHSFDKGWHHLYTGLICYVVGSKMKNEWVKTIGEVMIADDLVQHTFRVQSPLHMLNDNLWKHTWYQETTKFMDRVMGK